MSEDQAVDELALSDADVGHILGKTRQSVNGWRRNAGREALFTVSEVRGMIAQEQIRVDRMGERLARILTEQESEKRYQEKLSRNNGR